MRMSLKIIFLVALIGIASARNINQAGLDLIEEFEGFRANFYLDSVGIKTIGYGHACHANDCSTITEPITKAQAEALLKSDLVSYQNCVESAAPGLDDNKFAACVSFTYNLGCGSFQDSTLLKYLKAKNYAAAAGEFGKWVHAGGQVLQGLVRRREAERVLFCSSGGC